MIALMLLTPVAVGTVLLCAELLLRRYERRFDPMQQEFGDVPNPRGRG